MNIKKLNEKLNKILNETDTKDGKYVCVWSTSSYDVSSKDCVKIVDFDFFTEDMGYDEIDRKELLNLQIGDIWHADEPDFGHFVVKVPSNF